MIMLYPSQIVWVGRNTNFEYAVTGNTSWKYYLIRECTVLEYQHILIHTQATASKVLNTVLWDH